MRVPEINDIRISGRLVRDPEIRETTTGLKVMRFCIASSKSYKKNNEWTQDTTFIDCVAWKQQAEYLAQRVGKGSPVIVEGAIAIKEYTDKEGNKRKQTEIVVNKCHVLEKTEQQEEPKPSAVDLYIPGDTEEDIPF